ncbi:MAG: redoxin domain-containing protein [Sphingobacteriaceae bacterium]
MQKIKYLAQASLVLSILASGCKDKSAFTITGEIVNPKDVSKVYLFVADSLQLNVVDSAVLDAKHKFSFKHQSPFSNLYKIKLGESTFDLIAKNGDDIDFKTDMADSAHVYQVSGSEDSEKIKEFNEISNLHGGRNAKLVEAYQLDAKKIGKESDSLLNVYMPTFQQNMNDYGDAVLAFVDKNKKSLASFYAISSLDQIKYEQQMVNYAEEVKDNFKENVGVKQFVKHMMLVKPVSVGQQAPDFNLTDDTGKALQLSGYKGKYVMLDFWASWCAPCRQENPNVVRLYNEYKDKGFNIVGISLDEDKKAWQQAIKDDKLTWRHATEAQRFDGAVVKTYQIEAIPSSFIIDPTGKIVAKNLRGNDLEAFLKTTFSKSN